MVAPLGLVLYTHTVCYLAMSSCFYPQCLDTVVVAYLESCFDRKGRGGKEGGRGREMRRGGEGRLVDANT